MRQGGPQGVPAKLEPAAKPPSPAKLEPAAKPPSPPEAGCPAGRGRGLRGLAEEGAGTCRDKRLDF